MAILSINVNTTGLVGQTINPRRNTMITTDSLATITTAGYLNGQNASGNPILPTDVFDVLYSFNEHIQQGTYGVFQVSFSPVTGFSLVQWANPGDVLLPVTPGHFAVFNAVDGQVKDAGFLPSDPTKTHVAMTLPGTIVNHIATYIDTNGTIGEDASTAINAGSIQAGVNGHVGTFISYPVRPNLGTFTFVASNSLGDFSSILTNGAVGQDTVWIIPDPGAGSSNIVQTTATIVDGNISMYTGTSGLLSAGLPPSAPAQAFVVMSPGALTAGNFPVLSDVNGTLATGLPPSAAAQAFVSVSPGGLVAGNLMKLGDANGTIADQGNSMKVGKQVAVAGGSNIITVTDAFCQTTSCVLAIWNDTTNPAGNYTIAAGAGSFTITATADPGPSHLNYVIFN